MSNQLAAKPWVVDTASATAITTQYLKICEIEWVGYDAASHTVVVTDKNGNEVWRALGNSDKTPVISRVIGWVEGLIVSTLDSGKLLITIE